jgi:hypothetical protein
VSATLSVRGSAREIGERILVAPGPEGGVYVSIPRPDGSILPGSVLALLDRSGRPSPGWPIAVSNSYSCPLLAAAEDGSVRVVCHLPQRVDQTNFAAGLGAFAFDSGGRLLAGWPIALDDYGVDGLFTGRVIGDELTLYADDYFEGPVENDEPGGSHWLLTVAADGTVRDGERFRYEITHTGYDTWAIGPDGIAYGTVRYYDNAYDETTSSELTALGPAGVPAGFPVALDGIASKPAFDAAGRIHVTIGSPIDPPARTLVFDANGRAVEGGSGALEMTATNPWTGAGAVHPGVPLVAADGTTFVIDAAGDAQLGGATGGTTVAGLRPSGQALAGWPYRSDVGLEYTGDCTGQVGCGFRRAAPAIGPGDVLYLLHAAANSAVGGSVVAIGNDGRVVAGWPVELQRAGSEFWSVVVGADGTAYVLAIEPETGDENSASILAIAPDSTVLYATTIVEP